MTDEAFRAEVVIASAKLRAELALREARRQLFGEPTEEERERNVRTAQAMLDAIRAQPAPSEPSSLDPVKRHRWAMKLRGW